MPNENQPDTGRICKSCGTFKAWDHFDKKGNGINGHHSRCKVCVGKQKKKWWKKKNMKQRNYPNVLDFSTADISEKSVPFESREKLELEKALRNLVVGTFIKGRS